MTPISVRKMEAPIEIKVNGHTWELTQEEAKELRTQIGVVLDCRSEKIIERLKSLCARKFNVSVRGIDSDKRDDYLVQPRHSAMFLCAQVGFNQPIIGRHFNREHRSVSHALNCVSQRIDDDPDYRRVILWITEQASREIGLSFNPELKARLAKI